MNIEVVGETATPTVQRSSIVRLTPLEDTFWGRVDASLDAGFSFTQANTATQYSLNSAGTYTAPNYSVSATLDSLFRTQEGTGDTSRHTFSFGSRRTLGPRWFANAVSLLQHNKELDLNFRGTLGGGVGRFVYQSGQRNLSLWGGLAYTQEYFVGEDTSQANVESLAGVTFQTFIFGNLDAESETTLLALPSLSTLGRVRLELRSSVRRELVKDFYLNLSLTESYDSDPPAAAARKNDLVVTTSLGYSF